MSGAVIYLLLHFLILFPFICTIHSWSVPFLSHFICLNSCHVIFSFFFFFCILFFLFPLFLTNSFASVSVYTDPFHQPVFICGKWDLPALWGGAQYRIEGVAKHCLSGLQASMYFQKSFKLPDATNNHFLKRDSELLLSCVENSH